MRQLDTLSALISALGGDQALKNRVEAATAKLRTSLLDAVQRLHPEHVFTVPQKQSEACCKFLRTFLDRGGFLFSTNYDLLLYWVLMRNSNPDHEHVDGCGRELENPDDPEDEQQWSELFWGPNRDRQNVFYLHGALPFFDTGVAIVKEEYSEYGYLLENISRRMQANEYPIFVTAGDGTQKLTQIMHNHYLANCYERLCEIEGSLVTFGFNFGEFDEHIIDAINRAAKQGRKVKERLWSVYIGVYSEQDQQHIESIAYKFKCKVRIFDSKTVNVWGRSGF